MAEGKAARGSDSLRPYFAFNSIPDDMLRTVDRFSPEILARPAAPVAWAIVGHTFRILAFVSFLTVVGSFIRDRNVRLDLGFILLFWIGNGLLEGRPWPWRLAVAICTLMVAGAISSIGYSVFAHQGAAHSWGRAGNSLLYEFVHNAGILLIFLPPLTLLVRPSLLRTPVAEPDAATSHDPGHWSAPRFTAYVLGALLIGGLYAGDELMTGSVLLSRSSGAISSGASTLNTEVLSTASTAEAGPLFISSWVLGETNAVSLQSDSSTFSMCSTKVSPPDVRPGRYMRYLEFPGEPIDEPNMLLVRADGRILPIQRRVTLKSLPLVHAEIARAQDMAEIQRQIEALLPVATGSFPGADH